MKKKLKAIYDNISLENRLPSIKVEPVFESKGYNWTNRQADGYYQSNWGQNNCYCGSKRRDRFGRGEVNQMVDGSGGSINNEVRKRNPANSYGKVACCGICDSIYPWANKWNQSDPYNNSKVTLFTQETQKRFVENLLGETVNMAVLGRGSTKTVYVEKNGWSAILTASVTLKKKRYKVLHQILNLDGKWKKCSIRKVCRYLGK